MAILVTGGAGYVGGFAARHLLASGHDVVVIDNLCEGHREAIPPEILRVGEIADHGFVRGVIEEHSVDAVMHFAAFAYVGVSVARPRDYYRNNVAASLALLESLVDTGVENIVFSSSCSTYGETAEQPLRETTPQAPSNPYAFTKFCVERMIQDFAHAYGLSFALLRYFNAAGAAANGEHGEDHEPETHLIPLVLQTVLGKRERVEVFGDDYQTPDGTCVRDYIHVEDLADIHERAIAWCRDAEAGRGEAFNVGTGSGNSVLEVIRAAESVTGKRIPHAISPRRAGDPARLVASCEKAREMLGWKPRHTRIEEVVETAWEWHERHPDGY